MDKLLLAGADANLPNNLCHFPLHYAAMHGVEDVVSKLLKHSAKPDVKTHVGITPIMVACEKRHCGVVWMLSSECDLSHREQLYGGTVLHWAVATGCVSCVTFLLEQGADVRWTDNSGRTAIMQAIQSNDSWTLDLLLDKLTDKIGEHDVHSTVLHFAASIGHEDIVSVLCESEKSKHLINSSDCFGNFPLDMAIAGYEPYYKSMKIRTIETLQRFGGKRSPSCDNKGDFPGRGYSPFMFPSREKFSYYDKQITHSTREINSNADLIGAKAIVAALHNLVFNSGKKAENNYDCSNNYFPVFKTYSPIKMALVPIVKSVKLERVMSQLIKFNFEKWLELGPEPFPLHAPSLDMLEWLGQHMHSPRTLQEQCRGAIRRHLGYRADEKINRLPLPNLVKSYLNMNEMNGIVVLTNIQIREKLSVDYYLYYDVDLE